MHIACWITKATDPHAENVTHSFSKATNVTQKLLSVTLHVHCLSSLLQWRNTWVVPTEQQISMWS